MLRTLNVIVSCGIIALAWGGCNPDPISRPIVDIRGLSDADAADDIADAICSQAVECGVATYSCSSSSEGGEVCEGTVETVSYADCYVEVNEEIYEDLQGVELSEGEMEIVNGCVNAMVANDCVTQAQVDANVAAMNSGDDPDFEETIPVECAQIDKIFGDDDSEVPARATEPADPGSR